MSFSQPVTVTFPALDGVTVTADQYIIADSLSHPMILLCHQAGASRGEYKEIATMLNTLGFNCTAIDQRSGKECNAVRNQTAIDAKTKGKKTEYLDAEQDIIAAVTYLRTPILIWGSSYSAGLAMKIAAGPLHDHIRAVIAFSPGEYYGDRLSLHSAIQSLAQPAFVTSSRSESADLTALVSGILSVTQFIPKGEGKHGSSTLYTIQKDHAEYWDALKKFLAAQR